MRSSESPHGGVRYARGTVKSTLEYQHVNVGPVRLHVASAGTGPVVLLLHGFPETHRSWQLQIDALVDAGYRVVTPDLRGYGESDRPKGGYDLHTLSADIASLIRKVSSTPIRLIGHDWGGAIAWHVASFHGELVDGCVILDCPHPTLMARALRGNLRQLRRSWYMFFFQLPLLPVLWLRRDSGRNLARMFRAGSPRAAHAPRELNRCRAASAPRTPRAASRPRLLSNSASQ